MEAVFSGENRFPLLLVTGVTKTLPEPPPSSRRRFGELVVSFTGLRILLPVDCGRDTSFEYDAINDWNVIDDADGTSEGCRGIELWLEDSLSNSETKVSRNNADGVVLTSDRRDHRDAGPARHRRVFLGLDDCQIGVARNSLEFFWNMDRAKRQLPLKPGSVHGRKVASIVTLRGEVEAPAPPTGRVDPVDLSGVEVRVGQTMQLAKRAGKLTIIPSPRALLGVDKKVTLRHNPTARPHWEHVVMHQGWLRKLGGGAMKRWVWRYFVLYHTPQGHFLAYYNDVTDIPLFSDTSRERQLVDMCQVCFLRPEMRHQGHANADIPPNAFTVVTTERQWTLCAESQAGVLQWLRMISVAIDEDVAVVDDSQALFNVKARWAPSPGRYGPEAMATASLGSRGVELSFDVGETLLGVTMTQKAFSWGVAGDEATGAGDRGGRVRFWPYTDFFKWALVNMSDGSLGLAIQCFCDDQFTRREVSTSTAL